MNMIEFITGFPFANAQMQEETRQQQTAPSITIKMFICIGVEPINRRLEIFTSFFSFFVLFAAHTLTALGKLFE